MNRTEDGILSNVFKDRLPNIPFLFGNMDVGYQSEELFTKGDKFTATVGIYYVNQFYLFWPSQGSTSSKFNIPRQINFSTGITYSFAGEKYHLSLDCTNLSNAALYDNFRLQKPGRAFNFKIRYFLN